MSPDQEVNESRRGALKFMAFGGAGIQATESTFTLNAWLLMIVWQR
jgi:hypothetical protein